MSPPNAPRDPTLTGTEAAEQAYSAEAAPVPGDDDGTSGGSQREPWAIVGIGASAGGLEAYEQFFKNLPPATGLAFVLVPHLDPGHASILAEILQRNANLPVVEAQDQAPVLADRVYVIPPNRDMALFHGALRLTVPEMPRGQRMPIDTFMRSLAADQGGRAIGIVLSGTGTDGTQGLRAILDAGGLTLAQEPASARYDGMPLSAIQAGYAKHIIPVERMASVLLPGALTPGFRQAMTSLPVHELMPASAMNRVLMALRASTGHDFSLYKKSTLSRRIERRMAQHELTDIDVYCRYLKEHVTEAKALFEELLINVTSFFRDPEAFETLRHDVLPRLFDGKPEGDVFRVWVAGCASGEEAYSIAILLRDFLSETGRANPLQIYATDLDDSAIATARAGIYPPGVADDIGSDRLQRYFVRDERGYRIKKEVRELVVFATQNVIKDPPFTRLDLLSCRNLLIYLEAELQDRLIPAFHYALKPGGALFLSPSESVGNHTELFLAESRKWKLYRALQTNNASRSMVSVGLNWTRETRDRAPEEIMIKARETNFAELARKALLQSFAPASVVIDAKGNILYVHGETGRYLRPAPGLASLNVIDMASDGLQIELRAALQIAAVQGGEPVVREALISSGVDAAKVSLTVRRLAQGDESQGLLLVSFQEIAAPAPVAKGRSKTTRTDPSQRIADLERDLANTRENLQATIEEQQASNEELKATNEELQSTNEELQSTNEELETSKEELQSVNEELVTVNSELQAKIEQLAGMQNDMKNLLDNINTGSVFLDEHLCIRRFTREATQVYRLVVTDVGRPLADIKTNLVDDELLDAAQSVLATLVPYEREVGINSGATFLARIQPYRTLENIIEGVVLTFTDISKRIEAEGAERKARKLAESIVDTVREPLIVMDAAFRVVAASRSYYRHFQAVPGEVLGKPFFELNHRQWGTPALREQLERVLPRDQSFEGFELSYQRADSASCTLLLNGRRIVGKPGDEPLILLAMEVTART